MGHMPEIRLDPFQNAARQEYIFSRRSDCPLVLFVCTGNIFRSATAELFTRILQQSSDMSLPVRFESAGTRGRAEKPIPPDVSERQKEWIQDLCPGRLTFTFNHVSRPLTQELVDRAALIVAMDETHLSHIHDTFGDHINAHLFMKICTEEEIGIPDLPDVIPDYENKPEESRQFVRETIDRIHDLVPLFLGNLENYLPHAVPPPRHKSTLHPSAP